MGTLDLSLSLLGPILAGVLAVILLRRKVHREFPFFFMYVVFAILAAAVRLSVSGDYQLYFKVFWTTALLYNALALLALYEVFREVFFAFYELWWWFRLVFPGVALIAITIAVIRTILHPPVEATSLIGAILSSSRIVNYLEAILFALFFLLVLLLGVSRRSYPFGIVEGFGIAALGALVAYGLRSEFGTKYNMFAKYAPSVAYVLGVLVWLDTFRRPPDPEVIHAWREQVTPEQLLAQAREWLKIMKGPFKRHVC
jgi:hypothetical protein